MEGINSSQNRSISSRGDKLTRFLQKSYLYSCGFLLGISFLILISFSDLSRSNPLFQLLFFLPYVIYILVIILSQKFNLSLEKSSFLTIIIVAVIVQALLLLKPITLSDDIYRFFLEGKAIINGFNPYHIPLSELPANITEEYLAKANNTSLVSPYPPLALFTFLILALIFNNPNNFRIVFSIAFILAIIGLERLLSEDNKWKIVVFAWNPLLHLETASGSHFESLIVLILTIGLIGMENRKSVLAAICFLGAFFLKYYAIMFIILYWYKFTRRAKGLIAVTLTLYSLWVLLDPILIQGLLNYATDWYFNASLVWLVSETNLSLMQSKIIFGAIFIVIFGIVTVRVLNSKESSHETVGLVVGIFLILQPTFHPWYIFWIFPFILLGYPKVFWSWIALSGLLVLSYNVYILSDQFGIWYESPFIRFLEYTPFFLLFIYEFVFKGREDTLKRIMRVNQGA
ncbi:MAG: hypothetical protein ACXAC6_07835 [Candidatus Hodarchaeales archaeon]